MKTRAVGTLCVIVAFFYGQVTSTAYAADAPFCKTYADTAVHQYQRSKALQIPNLNPPVWSDNRPGHYKWCLSVSQQLAEQNTQYRERILSKPKPPITAVPMPIPPSALPQGPASQSPMTTPEPMPLPQAIPEQARSLTGDEIRALLSGNTMTVRRLETGAITLAYLRPDGVVVVRTPQGQVFAGAWTMEGDTYCSQVEQLREGRKACARLVQSAHQLFAYPPQGEQAVAQISILPGNPEKLGMAMTGQPATPPGVGMQPEPVLPGPGGKPGMPPAAAIENIEGLQEAEIQELAAPLSRKAKIEALLANPKMATELHNFAAKVGMQVDQLKHMSSTGVSFLSIPITPMDPDPDKIDWKKGAIFTPNFNYDSLFMETFSSTSMDGPDGWVKSYKKYNIDYARYLIGEGPAGFRPFRARLRLPKPMPQGTYILTLKTKVYEPTYLYNSHKAEAYVEYFTHDIWNITTKYYGLDTPWNIDKWGESVLKIPMQKLDCGYKICGYILLFTATNYKPAGGTLEFTITHEGPYRRGTFFNIEIEQL